MQKFFSAHRRSQGRGLGPPRPPQTHSAHYADANDAEISVNTEFIRCLESAFGPDTAFQPDFAASAFVDFIVEARKLERLSARGPIFQIENLAFPLSALLTHLPLQCWPLPHPKACPCPFCDEIIEPRAMEAHLEFMHNEIFRKGLHYSQVHLTIAGLLGIQIDHQRERKWCCPFAYCAEMLDTFSEIHDHILRDHKSHEVILYEHMGGFWAAVLCHFNEQGSWPKVDEIFLRNSTGQQAFSTAPLDRSLSDKVWRQNARQMTVEDLPGDRILAGSPFEELLFRLQRRASAQPSREVSDWDGLTDPGHQEEEEENSSEMLDRLVRELIHEEREQRGNRPADGEERPGVEVDVEGEAEEDDERGGTRAEAEGEQDTEHEDIRERYQRQTFGMERPVNEEILERMNSLAQVLTRGSRESETTHGRRYEISMTEEDGAAMVEDLERLLERFERSEIPLENQVEAKLEDPILLLLAQHRSFRICRREFFCPIQECRPHKPITSLGRLAIHIQTFHGAAKEETADMIRYFITKLLPNPIQDIFTTRLGHRVRGRRCLCRCHNPGCTYVSGRDYQVNGHVHNSHKQMSRDIQRLGWFWGTMHTMLKANPKMTIAEAIGEGGFWECTMEKCHLPFQSEKALRQHFTQAHAAYTVEGWEAKSRRLIQKLSERMEETEAEDLSQRDGSAEEGRGREAESAGAEAEAEEQDGGQVSGREAEAEASEEREARTRRTRSEKRKEGRRREAREEERFRRSAELRKAALDAEAANFRRDHELRQNPQVAEEQERQEREETARRRRCAEYIRKKERYERSVSSGVNIPQLNGEQMRRVKEGLKDLFKGELNPILEQMMPRSNDHEEWLGFEGAYEECMHRIREHILLAVGRDSKRLYGARQTNPKIQAATEKSVEVMVGIQQIRRDLKKLKDFLHTIAEVGTEGVTTEEEGEHRDSNEGEGRRRQRRRFTKRLAPILSLLPPETMEAYFGSGDHETIWQAMNTSEDHRNRVIDWLDAMITTQVQGEIKEMNKRAQALKIQEAYRTSKGIAMKRFIEKEQSPQCQIDMENVTEHFRETWSKPLDDFIEAEEESPFYLESRITGEDEDEMEEFMLDEKNIAEVIKSREDLSACGVDGISYRIMKGAGAEGTKFMKNIIRASLRCGRVISSWKEARTILIHKKGDREDVRNWRPISITNCMYRIFTCLMARTIQRINSKVHVFSDCQKGFIKKTNGCSEHGIILNELLHNANRNRESLIVTAIDFTNAFGSVPHDLIMSMMKQRNFPSWMQNIVIDMYRGATSIIEAKGGRSEKIGWKRGVKQGCPLSPLLFNLCLEPLLQAVERICTGCGVFVGPAGEKQEFTVQAYADDIIFISKDPRGIDQMLRVLDHFVDWSQMEVNVKKCATASYLIDRNRHRCSLARSLMFKGQDIPNLTLAQSLKYLGTAVAARQRVKLEAMMAKFTEMKIRMNKIMESPLLIVQKIDAIKTFILPTLDFAMLNGDVGEKQLMIMDQYIRGLIDKALKVRGLPIECHHASWRDGGLSYPSLVDRRRVLMIRSFAQMMLSKDEKVREAMRWFAENERMCRCIGEDEESEFLNWKDEAGEDGTASLTARTRKTCKKMKIGLKVKEDKMIIKTEESELQTISAVGIGRFLTQNVIRPGKYKQLIEHEVHGATYTTLKRNDVSNRMLIDIYTRKSDAFFRFVVVGRADCLPTPVNLRRWFRGQREETCRRCGQQRQQTMAHILNECMPNYPLMTKRHNRLVNIVRRGIEKFVAGDLRSAILENEGIPQEGLPEDLRRQRPDMIFERRYDTLIEGAHFIREGHESDQDLEEKIVEIIEFSCPYGYISRGRNTLERVYEEKKKKYERLARTLKQLRQEQVRITAVIVSSMGAVYNQSMKDLQKVLGCTDEKMRKLGQKMSETVLMGSMEIWRQNAHNNGREIGIEEEANTLVEEEMAILDADAAEQEARMRVDEYVGLDIEQDGADEHGERDSDDDFEPEDGLEDREMYIDQGFIRGGDEAEDRHELEVETGEGSEADEGRDEREREQGREEEDDTWEPEDINEIRANMADDEGSGDGIDQ
jgi:hypothetical protein